MMKLINFEALIAPFFSVCLTVSITVVSQLMSRKDDIKVALQQNTTAVIRPNEIQNGSVLMNLIDFESFLQVKNHIAQHHRLTSKTDCEKQVL